MRGKKHIDCNIHTLHAAYRLALLRAPGHTVGGQLELFPETVKPIAFRPAKAKQKEPEAEPAPLNLRATRC